MEKIYLVFDEYTYNGIYEGMQVIPCATKEIAIRVVKEKLEWYLKESYLATIDKDDLNDYDDSWEITEDYVDIYYSAKDTHLSLSIVESIIKTE